MAPAADIALGAIIGGFIALALSGTELLVTWSPAPGWATLSAEAVVVAVVACWRFELLNRNHSATLAVVAGAATAAGLLLITDGAKDIQRMVYPYEARNHQTITSWLADPDSNFIFITFDTSVIGNDLRKVDRTEFTPELPTKLSTPVSEVAIREVVSRILPKVTRLQVNGASYATSQDGRLVSPPSDQLPWLYVSAAEAVVGVVIFGLGLIILGLRLRRSSRVRELAFPGREFLLTGLGAVAGALTFATLPGAFDIPAAPSSRPIAAGILAVSCSVLAVALVAHLIGRVRSPSRPG